MFSLYADPGVSIERLRESHTDHSRKLQNEWKFPFRILTPPLPHFHLLYIFSTLMASLWDQGSFLPGTSEYTSGHAGSLWDQWNFLSGICEDTSGRSDSLWDYWSFLPGTCEDT